MSVGIGKEAAQFHFWVICFEFLVQCVTSALLLLLTQWNLHISVQRSLSEGPPGYTAPSKFIPFIRKYFIFDIGPSIILNDWKRTRLSCFVWFGSPPPLSSPLLLSCISFLSLCALPVEHTDGKGVGKEPKNTTTSKAWPPINHLILSDLAGPVYLYIFIS